CEHGNSDEPLVLLRQQTERGGTEIFLYTPIRGYQFTTTTTALDQMGLNVVDARIIPSRDSHTLDTYMVLEEDGEPIRGHYRVEEIRKALQHLLAHPEKAPAKVQRQMARQLKHFNIKTQVLFHNDPRKGRTVMEVITSDRPGLLSRIARALAACQIRMQNAKIATFGERVEDIFFITDEHNRPLEIEEQKSCLRERIIEALES
ncbi:MAG TPA: ACT domain-containing protein, partial [Candidatus Tectomicrobia bacterium]